MLDKPITIVTSTLSEPQPTYVSQRSMIEDPPSLIITLIALTVLIGWITYRNRKR